MANEEALIGLVGSVDGVMGVVLEEAGHVGEEAVADAESLPRHAHPEVLVPPHRLERDGQVPRLQSPLPWHPESEERGEM